MGPFMLGGGGGGGGLRSLALIFSLPLSLKLSGFARNRYLKTSGGGGGLQPPCTPISLCIIYAHTNYWFSSFKSRFRMTKKLSWFGGKDHGLSHTVLDSTGVHVREEGHSILIA